MWNKFFLLVIKCLKGEDNIDFVINIGYIVLNYCVWCKICFLVKKLYFWVMFFYVNW